MAVWGTTTVPHDEHGTWWIANAAQYRMDLDRKVRWSQHKLEVVETETKAVRFLRYLDAVDREESAAGAAAPDVGAAAPDAAGAGATDQPSPTSP